MGSITRIKKRLGDLLVDAGIITESQLNIALNEQKKVKGRKLGETLIDLGFTDEIEIADALKQQLRLDMVILSGIRIPGEILKLISDQTVLRKNMIIPFAFKDNNPNVLRVAMADPMDIVAMDDLRILTNLQIEPVVSTTREIAGAIDKYFGNAEIQAVAAKYTLEKEQQYQAEAELAAAYNADVNNSPIVILVRTIIEQAVRQRASDIHIEAMEDKVRVRYRVDGILYEAMTYQADLLSAIVARIKIIGDMDISEKRKPQDGRMTITVDRQEFDIRISILPTVFGEKVVLRLTSKKTLSKAKKELGLTEEDMVKFDRLLLKPHGMILVTGPTGSGKSTTLYTALNEINKNNVNIITVEDPVEANITGVNQVQVNSKSDLTFANALRSILRQDPDIIMVGEIRDEETASIAVKASITGHLVVSTLHTNNAASTITRLVDMGIEPFLLADAMVGVIAQRLVRRLCKCKKPRYVASSEKEYLNIAPDKEQIIYEPCGCQLCNDTGFYGRIGIYEIMPITPKIRDIISKRKTADEIMAAALEEGMRTLRMNASKYVLDGITSLGEMKRVSFEDMI
ncbi:type II secretion system protein GspE [Anaerocolumna sedimenticola]|uniref:Type II secretion system protein GspE n=1 Tax=Anaerocolumna sedimenticola TaxID=2696063 RepID=A0A6P1TPY2_9FIRM|nr:ATPase, T2SS/T4P/T4SS family [Anaerocolumna sedimenticola]QHQ61951.1 type II secretion system protein GspE [Anaerocolumna sedimenticola]